MWYRGPRLRAARAAAAAAFLAAVGLLAPAGLLAGAARAADYWPAPPIPWQDQGPVSRLSLQPPFEAPELLAPGNVALEARLAYSNSVFLAANDRLRVQLDGETLRTALVLRYGLLDRLEATFELPIFLDHGGALDGTIEAVEQSVGALNAVRRQLPRDAATFTLARPGGPAISRRGDDLGIGDVVVGVRLRVLEQAGWRPAVSLRGLVKAPTGNATFGSEGTDVGVGVLAGWSWRRAALRLALDVVHPGDALDPIDVDVEPYGAVQVGLAVRASRRLALHLQASGHSSPIRGTGLAPLEDPAFYVLAGASYAFSRHVSAGLGIAENVFSPESGADITLVGTIRARF